MTHLEPREAFELLQRTPDALFVDCRSELEHLFVGHPTGAIQVTWSAEFVTQMRAIAAHDRTVVLICRSGNRSVDAGEALEAAGFTNVYNVLHGFEGALDHNNRRSTRSGWRFEGLPWEQC